MFMGHFEERTPKMRKVAKYILTNLIVCLISVYAGRTVSMTILGLLCIPVLYIHAYWLPVKKGINGWTGEPKAKYYEFRGWSKDIFRDKH
jgi:hypothetical protein